MAPFPKINESLCHYNYFNTFTLYGLNIVKCELIIGIVKFKQRRSQVQQMIESKKGCLK